MTDQEWNQMAGEFTFHLEDTHGIPREVTEEWLIKDGNIQLAVMLIIMGKYHKDFIRRWNKIREGING